MKLLLNVISQLSLFNNIFQSEIKIGLSRFKIGLSLKQERSWKGNFAYDLCFFMYTIDVTIDVYFVVVLFCIVLCSFVIVHY